MADDWEPTLPYGWRLTSGPVAEGFRMTGADPPETLTFELTAERTHPQPPDLHPLVGVVDGSDRFGAPPGAVLCESYTLTPTRVGDGSCRWGITVRLVRRDPSWNHARRLGGSFEAMTDANGNPPYASTDVFGELERLACG